MIYRAFANGEEITDFPISGVDTNAIYGGDVLLWKKDGGIDFVSVRKMVHCGKRTVIFTNNFIATFKSSSPYYEEILKRPIWNSQYYYNF